MLLSLLPEIISFNYCIGRLFCLFSFLYYFRPVFCSFVVFFSNTEIRQYMKAKSSSSCAGYGVKILTLFKMCQYYSVNQG